MHLKVVYLGVGTQILTSFPAFSSKTARVDLGTLFQRHSPEV